MKIINKKYGIAENPKTYLLLEIVTPGLCTLIKFVIGLTSIWGDINS